MDYRQTFNLIPEQFDKYRPRYCKELFDELILQADLANNSTKRVLEIGPGTGQATEPILKSGCDYTAIELGKPFTDMMVQKFSSYANFHIVNDDYETYDFKKDYYDLVYSAATIQWIPEKIAFQKAYDMLKPGGYLAMFMTHSDETSLNKELRTKIDEVYKKHFVSATQYTCRIEYNNVVNYGFKPVAEDIIYKKFVKKRTLNAEEYINYISTHIDHINLIEPHKTDFYQGIREAFEECGGKMDIIDTIPLYLVRK